MRWIDIGTRKLSFLRDKIFLFMAAHNCFSEEMGCYARFSFFSLFLAQTPLSFQSNVMPCCVQLSGFHHTNFHMRLVGLFFRLEGPFCLGLAFIFLFVSRSFFCFLHRLEKILFSGHSVLAKRKHFFMWLRDIKTNVSSKHVTKGRLRDPFLTPSRSFFYNSMLTHKLVWCCCWKKEKLRLSCCARVVPFRPPDAGSGFSAQRFFERFKSPPHPWDFCSSLWRLRLANNHLLKRRRVLVPTPL